MTDSPRPRRVVLADDPGQDPYRWMGSLVLPRPIAWVSTVSADGVDNLAPHSFFTVACAHPPILAFSSVGKKDTLANVVATGEFVVSLANQELMDRVNQSSAPFPSGVSEASVLGIDLEPSEQVRPRRVAGSPAAMECVLHSTQELGDSTLVLGRVVAFVVAEDALAEDGLPDVEKLRPVSRLGRNQWGLAPTVVAVDRPQRPEDVLGD